MTNPTLALQCITDNINARRSATMQPPLTDDEIGDLILAAAVAVCERRGIGTISRSREILGCDCYSDDTGYTYNIEVEGEDVSIVWIDADGVEQAIACRAPGGALVACDVPAEDVALLASEVARLAAKSEG